MLIPHPKKTAIRDMLTIHMSAWPTARMQAEVLPQVIRPRPDRSRKGAMKT